MPNKKSAMKELRKTEKRTARNSLAKRRLKELMKKLDKVLNSEDKTEATTIYNKVQKLVDKASKRKHPFTTGKAKRIKSRVAKKIGKSQKSETKKSSSIPA
jgi:small subunit ribosomal protein S20